MNPSSNASDLQTPKPATKTGIENARDRGHPLHPADQSPMPETQQDTEFWPLSGKPYFSVVLTKLHLAKSQMILPRRMSMKLPAATVPAKILCRGKVWDLVYHGDQFHKRLQNQSWRKFTTDNNLGVGDACVFELMEGGSNSGFVKFKVQILKGNFPSKLLEKAEGVNMNNPIMIE